MMERRSLAVVGLLVLGLDLLGCSALISPDVDRLGAGEDGGRVDGGSRDAGRDAASDAQVGDGGPPCPDGCDDELDCTLDACVDGRCVHRPDDARCGGDERCSPVIGCVPGRCREDRECDDGRFCNGVERCDPAAPGTGCVEGAPPTCDDRASCTIDRCDAGLDRCVYEPMPAACADMIDCTIDLCDPTRSTDPSGCVRTADDARCAADFCVVGSLCSLVSGCSVGTRRDCSDGDPCTTNTCDGAAARCVSTPLDVDGDGFPARAATGPAGVVACAGGTDCNDSNPNVFPGAPEACGNGIDDDCDGPVDEGCAALPDDCASAGTIALSTAGSDRVGSARGSIGSFRSDYQPSSLCPVEMGGRDAVYVVEVPSGTWDATIDTLGSTFDTVLGVGVGGRDACSASLLQTVCNDDYDSSSVATTSRVWVHRVTGGGTFGASTYLFISVDAYSGAITTGDFVLNVRLSPARADQCPSGSSTPFDISGGGTVLGFQTGFAGSQRGSCQPTADIGGEAVFFLRGPSSGEVSFEAYSREFNPALYLRERPCAIGSELDCELGSSIGGGVNRARLSASVTAGEAHFFFLDGGRGAYVLRYRPR